MLAVQDTNKYLTNMPTDVINEFGLAKTLLTRRETIYLKHVLKNIFIYGDENEINDKLEYMQFKSPFQYFAYVTDKIRGVYKLPREYKAENADKIVKQKRDSIIGMLEMYKDTSPIVILDFDRTITNKKFHSLYHYLVENNFNIIINSANPNREAIIEYLEKHNLKIPNTINANKGKKKKIVKLKEIVHLNTKKIIFYIDDETEYLDYGCLLFMYCYQYRKNGKIYNHTIFKK